MPTLMLIVAQLREFPWRGVMVFPEPGSRWETPPRLGDPVVLKRPDGTTLERTIGGVETLATYPFDSHQACALLFLATTAEEVPIGTEVWLVR